MSKINVDKDLCIGCGACVSIANETFIFGDDGFAETTNNEVTEEVKDAVESCPTNAITIND